MVLVLLGLFAVGLPIPHAFAAGRSDLTARGRSQAARPTLRRGSRGAAVRELQTLLNTWISATPSANLRPLPVNGSFGAATDKAVRVFQQANGLTVDGIVGAATWQRLDAFKGSAPAPAPAPAPQAPMDDAAYAQYLRTKFAVLGGHRIQFDKVDVRQDTSASGPYRAVTFVVGDDEAEYLIYNGRRTDMQSWGQALLQELQAHWPNQQVLGNLEWQFYLDKLYPDDDCHFTGHYSTYEHGWFQIDTFVSVYTPSARVHVCGGN
jgi:hypothetical protein